MLWEWKQIVSATETEVLQRAPSKGDLPAFVYSELARPVNITDVEGRTVVCHWHPVFKSS